MCTKEIVEYGRSQRCVTCLIPVQEGVKQNSLACTHDAPLVVINRTSTAILMYARNWDGKLRMYKLDKHVQFWLGCVIASKAHEHLTKDLHGKRTAHTNVHKQEYMCNMLSARAHLHVASTQVGLSHK